MALKAGAKIGLALSPATSVAPKHKVLSMAQDALSPVDRMHDLETIRARSWTLLATAERGRSQHFTLDGDAMAGTATALADIIRAETTDLTTPMETCWSLIERESPDLLDEVAGRLEAVDVQARARAGFDLALAAILHDPAGDNPAGRRAAFEAWLAGDFQADDGAGSGLEADEAGLVRGWPPVVAERLRAAPRWFGAEARFGRLVDALLEAPPVPAQGSEAEAVSAAPSSSEIVVDIGGLVPPLATLIDPLIEGGVRLAGRRIGDVGRHPAVTEEGPTHELVPFQAAMQRLVAGLIDPLREAGVQVDGIERLTAPPTRRLAGAMLALGIVVPRHSAVRRLRHPPGSDIVVELRALSVALADRLADRVRAELGITGSALPAIGLPWALGRLVEARSIDTDAAITIDSAWF